MQVATLNDEETVKIPKSIQDALGVRPGDQIGFEVRGDGTVLVCAAQAEKKLDLMSLQGILNPGVRGVTVEQMNETIRKCGGSGV